MTRYDLPTILYDTLAKLGGKGTIVDVCKMVWDQHQAELMNSNELFYTWQYDIRWAATELRKHRQMKAADISPKGIWEIEKPTV